MLQSFPRYKPHLRLGSRYRVGRLLPRVDYGYTGCLEITHILSDNRHAMHERSCCDEGITIGARIWHMKRSASLGHSSINH